MNCLLLQHGMHRNTMTHDSAAWLLSIKHLSGLPQCAVSLMKIQMPCGEVELAEVPEGAVMRVGVWIGGLDAGRLVHGTVLGSLLSAREYTGNSRVELLLTLA